MGTAAGLAAGHTLIGPDHYLPFIMMAKARRWSMVKTFWITLICGLGHVLSSVALGAFGIAAGSAVGSLNAFEGNRGDIAAWLLIAFGLAYCVWGVRRAILNKPHTHRHLHQDGKEHEHEHDHHEQHAHPHDQEHKSITPWVLFVIFVFGPCEPLIPILMYPAFDQGLGLMGVAAVAAVFSIVTISTMLGIVMAGAYGLSFARLGKLERYTHALAGAMVLVCGLAIKLGL